MMASPQIPLNDLGHGCTIVTQVVPSTTVSVVAEQNLSQIQSPLKKFLKGEPKALGVVQIMIALLTILFGIVMMFPAQTASVFSGVVFWGSLIHISAGSLAVSASNKLNVCKVKAALVLNIFSTIAAGITVIMLSMDLLHGPVYNCYYNDYYYGYGCRYNYIAASFSNGITGVLLLFSLLQFAVSITVSAFTCKATCTDQPTLNIINVVQNPASGVPVVISNPAYHAQPGVHTINDMPRSSSPPVYYGNINGTLDNSKLEG
ncbi:membrane-spanning 4-domains subfamily A member 4A-like [Clarias gariepinus]|uniref:membrane-spanning 4-domains subfamily A member 4A-like n=1 Tax=Clarias gariepinus TaxID=13013 RepID=UPI00234DF2DC|nr:membrane-spanning 4-domains subfamily A member 4A-like [Clarias gariepinus]